MKNRLRALIFILLYVLGSMTSLVMAIQPSNSKSFDFEQGYCRFKRDSRYNEGNYVMVVEFDVYRFIRDNHSYEITIPDFVTYEGVNYAVSRIGEDAFPYYGKQPLAITLSKSITEIDKGAFSFCTVKQLKFTNPTPPSALRIFDYDWKKDSKHKILVPQGALKSFKNDPYFKVFSIKEYTTTGQNLLPKSIIITPDNRLFWWKASIEFAYQDERLKMVNARDLSGHTFSKDNGEAFFYTMSEKKLYVNRMVGESGHYKKMRDCVIEYKDTIRKNCPISVNIEERTPEEDQVLDKSSFMFSGDCLSSYTFTTDDGGAIIANSLIGNGLINKFYCDTSSGSIEISYSYSNKAYKPEGVDVLSYFMSHNGMFDPRTMLWFLPEVYVWKKLPSKITWSYKDRDGHTTKQSTATFNYEFDTAGRLSIIKIKNKDDMSYTVEITY